MILIRTIVTMVTEYSLLMNLIFWAGPSAQTAQVTSGSHPHTPPHLTLNAVHVSGLSY